MTEPSRAGGRLPRPGDTLHWLRSWAYLLDARFRIPGTSIRFGIDPILAVIPGLGDLASPIFTVALLVQGLHQRVPAVILVRMALNALLDAFIGAVPLARGPRRAGVLGTTLQLLRSKYQ